MEIRDWTARTQHSRFFLLFSKRLEMLRFNKETRESSIVHICFISTWLLSAPLWECVGGGGRGIQWAERISPEHFEVCQQSSQPPGWACVGSVAGSSWRCPRGRSSRWRQGWFHPGREKRISWRQTVTPGGGKIESYFVNEATKSTFNLKSLQVAHSGSAILRHRHLKVRQLVERWGSLRRNSILYIFSNCSNLNLLWPRWQLRVTTEGEGSNKEDEVSDRLCWLGICLLLQLQQEFREKYITLACPEVVQ